MTTLRDVPILIVGAGPAGLTASLLLARYGVASLVVEKHPQVSPFPRARGVHARAMEILRGCGLEDKMRAQELPITPGAEWRRDLTGPPLREVATSGPDFAPVSPCDGIAVAQDVFESVLRAHLAQQPAARLELGVEVTAVRGLADGAVATLRNLASGQESEIRAEYVIAADGARSAVRKQLNIPMHGAEDLGSQIGIAFRADLEPQTGTRPRGIYFLTDSGAALFSTHPDSRWALSAPDTGGLADPVATVRRITGIADLTVEIIASSRWTAAARTATRYSSGRVFLIGDAAHQTPPAGATGVSTAMADAHNLCWKLAAVVQGRAGQALLDSYTVEREPVGRRNVEELGAAWTAITSGGPAPSGRSLRQIDMGFRYTSDAVCADEGADGHPSQDVPVTPDGDYQPNATPGGRAPHLWIEQSGGRISIIDLFGPDLTLLTGPQGRGWLTAIDDLAAIGATVQSHQIDDPEWPTTYGITPTGAVLVRPDGHVAWRNRQLRPTATTRDHDLLIHAVNQTLALNNHGVSRD